ncbi:L-seryl-tRNA(Sec) selenium transferase [Clostridium chrysemydis]|uniref:L-seryl-tRNA(Sec) selenium transferase n=1 Tax=Clostridium chrysemydis TaxID=2665504 RepID=UPI001883D0FF|nr:L-seryl-tRNA(Sec) selenium transferase [Clostridium chrysemydis]
MELLRKLPKINELLEEDIVKSYLKVYSREIVVEKLRLSIDILRKRILKMEDMSSIFSLKEESLKIFKDNIDLLDNKNLKRVVNGTGIVIHTNLGRSLLSSSSLDAIIDVSKYYSNLEFNLEEGKRGSRYDSVIEELKYLTSAEDALVVNNNASAVLLVLSALAKGKEAIISRGELVEIGGSFRIPDILELSGGILKEVGTTNRTHIFDYENAINENTGVILKVHTSNYRVLGFTKEVKSDVLSEISRKNNIPLVEDLGSGLIDKLNIPKIEEEKTVKECINNGVNIVTFSGDKLLGGPQCGVIVGDKRYIEKIKKHQLNRALRVDKFTLAALEATLKEYIKGNYKNIPTINLLELSLEEIEKKADKLKYILENLNLDYKISKSLEKSLVGGGSLPTLELETYVLKIRNEKIKEHKIDEMLRREEIPVIGRVSKGDFIIDLRCILEDDYKVIEKAFKNIGEIL